MEYDFSVPKMRFLDGSDTKKELDYYKAGGILNFVLNGIISNAA